MKTKFASKLKILRALSKGKTVMNFQYIENDTASYMCYGELGELFEFISGSFAKMMIETYFEDERVQ